MIVGILLSVIEDRIEVTLVKRDGERLRRGRFGACLRDESAITLAARLKGEELTDLTFDENVTRYGLLNGKKWDDEKKEIVDGIPVARVEYELFEKEFERHYRKLNLQKLCRYCGTN